jgi:glycogen debranching enzyme
MTSSGHGPDHPRQPLLHDSIVVLQAPTQVWSGAGGDAGASAIDGVYHGDVRHVRALSLECADSDLEWLSVAPDGPSRVVFGGLLRALDDPTADPKVRLVRDRRVGEGSLEEIWTVESNVAEPIRTTLTLRVTPDFASLHEVKAGMAEPRAFAVEVTDAAASASADDQRLALSAPGAEVSERESAIVASWSVLVAPGDRTTVRWRLDLDDPTLVVRGAAGDEPKDAAEEVPTRTAGGADPRAARWLIRARGDLDALRLALPAHPSDEFFAAGAPWFLTLFGRDSLWAARLALPIDTRTAASTLRVLARLQGTTDEPLTAEEPGKILHELRASALELPHEGVVLPPVYYGSVDSTPLWICLLVDAWRAGMPEREVRELLPALERAVRWVLEHGDSDGDGFLDYIDRSGRGLANQGWKDSGDSIQWRDGRLAQGPIALCEVQGYAYEAVLGAADLFEQSGSTGLPADELRAWAAGLKERFAESYWVQTPEGEYPAIALDAHKRPVDTLTSNIGHLLGTGILEPHDERRIADLLVGPSMLSGYGIRTMSTGAAGYWPLSYHGGSVWTHDTAIIARGMAAAGLDEHARTVVDGMLAAAEGFEYRVPELHAGDPAESTSVPVPYPAACRPQAWSAAAAITAASIAGTIQHR